jgi:NAD(P)-dependent dehydrogenase (short-subunit alcohol dehydrogenase family)
MIEKTMFDIHNKNIILTGSAGFLGTQFAHILSNAGANVILLDVNSKENKKLENELIEKYHTSPLALTVDISNQLDVKNSLKKILKNYDTIDALVNNAQFLPRTHDMRDASFENYPFNLWDKTISKNLNGIFLCCKEIGGVMLKQNKGIIVNISSIYGIQGPDQRIYGKSRLNSPAFYSVTKGGIVNLTRYLAALWGRKNIRVNTLTLGGVYNKKVHKQSFKKLYSKKTMIGRMGNVDDYDGALIFLLSNASSYMTGTNLIIDGGWSSW